MIAITVRSRLAIYTWRIKLLRVCESRCPRCGRAAREERSHYRCEQCGIIEACCEGLSDAKVAEMAETAEALSATIDGIGLRALRP
jgi:hypothetical protein